MTIRALLCTCLFFGLALSTSALAQSRDLTQVGHTIVIGTGQDVGDATCFGCSIRVHGHVNGDVTSFGGSVTVDDQAQVDGDITVFGGGIRIDHDVKVAGDVTVFGGQIHRDSTASIGGDVTSFSGGGWILLIFVLPLILFGGFVTLVVWLIRRLLRPAMPAVA